MLRIEGFAVRLLLLVVFFATIAFVKASRLLRAAIGVRGNMRPPGRQRMVLTGSFYNENWCLSHLLPISACDALERVTAVCDGYPQKRFPKITFVRPPAWIRCFGRMPARAMTLLITGFREKPDFWVGYHIMPNSIFCLWLASLFGGRSIYQMTGGPIQIIGGGHQSENALLRRLRSPSPLCQRALYNCVRLFDCVLVRGTAARAFVVENQLNSTCEILTGSVDTEHFRPGGSDRRYDIVYVSRLIENKGIEAFLGILLTLKAAGHHVRAAVVGDGFLRARLEEMAKTMGVSENCVFLGKRRDVNEILAQAKIFMLLSKTEGMSIAMLEALAAGLPAVVTDVGELKDIIEHGRSGYLVPPDKPEQAVPFVIRLLNDSDHRDALAAAARRRVLEKAGIDVVAERWKTILLRLSG